MARYDYLVPDVPDAQKGDESPFDAGAVSAKPKRLMYADRIDVTKPPAAPPSAQPQVPAENESRSLGQIATDLGTGVVAGTQGLIGATASLADVVSGGLVNRGFRSATSALDRALGGPGTETGVDQAFTRSQDAIRSVQSPQLKAEQQKLSDIAQDPNLSAFGKFAASAGEVLTNPTLASQMLVESAPNLVPALGIAARAGAAAEAAAIARGMSAKLAREAGEKAAQRASVGIAGGMGAGYSAQEAAERIYALPEEQLRQQPAIQALMDQDMTFEQARDQLVQQAKRYAAPIGGTLSAAAGRVAAPFEAKLVTRGLTGNRLGAAGSGALREGAEEAIQEPSEGLGANVGIRESGANPDLALGEGLASRAGAGAVLGAIMGGGLGAVAGGQQPTPEESRPTAPLPPEPARRPPPQDAAGLTEPEVQAAQNQARAEQNRKNPGMPHAHIQPGKIKTGDTVIFGNQPDDNAYVVINRSKGTATLQSRDSQSFDVSGDALASLRKINTKAWSDALAEQSQELREGYRVRTDQPRLSGPKGIQREPTTPQLESSKTPRLPPPDASGPRDTGSTEPPSGPGQPPAPLGRTNRGLGLSALTRPGRNQRPRDGVSSTDSSAVVGALPKPRRNLGGEEPVGEGRKPYRPQGVGYGDANARQVKTGEFIGKNETRNIAPRTVAQINAVAQQAATGRNALPEPTDAQKSAGNYQKSPEIKVAGIPIKIENPAGSKRRPEWPPLRHHYGDIKRTVGSEGETGEGVDVFVNRQADMKMLEQQPVHIVNQRKPDGKGFDEHKVMIGFPSGKAAEQAYMIHYGPDIRKKLFGGSVAMSMDDFKAWLKNHDMTKPAEVTDNAQTVRSDTGQTTGEGSAGQRSQNQGRQDIQRETQAGTETGQQQTASVTYWSAPNTDQPAALPANSRGNPAGYLHKRYGLPMAEAKAIADSHDVVKNPDGDGFVLRAKTPTLRESQKNTSTPEAVDKTVTKSDSVASKSEQPEPQKKPSARDRYRKDKRVSPEQDDILAAIAKLGGLSREDADQQGVDPAEFGRRGWRIQYVFTKNGKSFDAMAETLSENGYPVLNDQGRYDANVLLDKVSQALLGKPVYTPSGFVARAEQEAAEQSDIENEIAEQDDPFDILDDAGELLVDEEYNADSQGMFDDRVLELAAKVDTIEQGAGEAILERAAMSEASNDETVKTLEAFIARRGQSKRNRKRETSAQATTGAEGQGRAEVSESFELNQQTEDDIRAAEERARQAKEAEAKRKAEEDAKAKADQERGEFELTGSDRPADRFGSKQSDLLGAAPTQPPSNDDIAAMFDELLVEQDQGEENVSSADSNLESDRGDANTEESVGKKPVRTTRSRDGGGARPAGRKTESQPRTDEGVSDLSATTGRERSNQQVHNADGAFESAGGTARDTESSGSAAIRKGRVRAKSQRTGESKRPSGRSASESLKSAVSETASGFDAAIKGLGELFGGKGTVRSGLAFDEETYAKAKPFFIQAVTHFGNAAADLRDVMRSVIKAVTAQFGIETTANMKPYIVRFTADVRDGKISIPDEVAADTVIEEAQQEQSEIERKRQAQQKAQTVDVKPGDRSNISQSLPFLLEGQQDDVKFAEDRFAKSDGYGVLFTNGTGTGKTFTGLGIVKRFERQGRDNILIAVPSQKIADDWISSGKELLLDIQQLESTSSNGSKGIVVTTYANLGSNPNLNQRNWDLVLADESHKLMENAAGDATSALQNLRAITLHPDGVALRVDGKYPKESEAYQRARETYESVMKYDASDIRSVESATDKLEEATKAYNDAREKIKVEVAAAQGTDARPRVVFLSATPFAYAMDVDYAQGYLFQYGQGYNESNRGRYNQPDERGHFMVQHFGYRMRYGKLTKPDADVDASIMEIAFNGWLKQQGVASSRLLDVDKDYDRKFILAESAIGTKIDEGMDFLREGHPIENDQGYSEGKYHRLYNLLQDRFTYHNRMFLLEAIKARSVIPIIQNNIENGRKVVVFHDFNKGGGFHPFRFNKVSEEDENGNVVAHYQKLNKLIDDFNAERPDLVNLDFSGLVSPIAALQKAFPNALFFNGTVDKKTRSQNVALFNRDTDEYPILVVQSDAGKEGISLHDRTGKYQRALFNLGMPVKPTAAIQIEGRIYRTGQQSNALFRYLNTGTNFERWTFASKISERAGTAENLAMGEDARALKTTFVDAFESPTDGAITAADGTGGKEADRVSRGFLSEFDKAKTFYFSQQKNSKRRDQREGKDYFATPEPLALKMVQWADIRPKDKVLEPSAGHGAIARFFPENAQRTIVEPSFELASRAALVAGGAKLVNSRFEDHNIVNKYDAIVMNPPFGQGGKLAFDHLKKAVAHLRDGGRIVALVPTGPAADKQWNKLLDSDEFDNLYIVADIGIPGIAFERAGTNVRTRVLVLDKISDPNYAYTGGSKYDVAADDIKEFFDSIENKEVRERPVVRVIRDEEGRGTGTETVDAADLTPLERAKLEIAEDTVKDKPVWRVTGSGTFKYKDLLRKLGGKWYPPMKAWTFFDNDPSEQIEAALTADTQHSRRSITATAPKRGLKTAVVQQQVAAFLKRYQGAQQLHFQVFATQAEAFGADSFKLGILKAGIQGNNVILVAENLDSPADVQAQIRHEVIAHYGMRALLGADFDALLDEVRAAEDGPLADVWADIRKDYPDVSDDVLADEVIARIAEDTSIGGQLRTLWARIRKMLQSIGLIAPQEKIDRTEIAGLLAESAAALRRGDTGIDGRVSRFNELGGRKSQIAKGAKVKISSEFSNKEAAGKAGIVLSSFGKGQKMVQIENGKSFVVADNLLTKEKSSSRFRQISEGENSYKIKQWIKKNPDIQYRKAEPGELFQRIVWGATGRKIETNPSDVIGIPAGVYGLHVSNEADKWGIVLEDDYGRDGKTHIIEIAAMDGDIVVDDPQQAMPTEIFGRVLDSSILVTGRELLQKQKDKVFYSRSELPDTIEVDGKQRPTRNSEGRVIHPTAEGVRNFWRWFGSSRVVDDQGRPLVVYHGTKSDFSEFDIDRAGQSYGYDDMQGFFFSSDRENASYIASEDAVGNSANVMPAYINATSPLLKKSKEYATNFADKNWRKLQTELDTGDYDGIIVKSDDETLIFVSDPNQVKSAIGNTGAFNPSSPDIRFSRVNLADAMRGMRGTQSEPSWLSNQSDAIKSMASKVGAKPKNLIDRLIDLEGNIGTWIRQGTIDRYAKLLQNDIQLFGRDALETNTDTSGWALAKMSTAFEGAVEALFKYGKLKWDGKAIAVDENSEGLAKVLEPVAQIGELDRFMLWMTANRAQMLSAQDRENLFTDDEIKDGVKLDQGRTAAGSDRAQMYADVYRGYRGLQKSVLDLAEQGGLIDGNSRQMWEHEFYIPFYRVLDDKQGGPLPSNKLVRQEAFKRLKGGKDKIGDPLENILLNWSHLVSATLKNQAAQQSLQNAAQLGIARRMKQFTKKGTVFLRDIATGEVERPSKSTVWILENGKKVYYNVDDVLTLEAISALHEPMMSGAAIRALAGFKRALTFGVTIAPAFKIRNLLRDSISSIAVSGVNKNFLGNIKTGYQNLNGDTSIAKQMLAGGGLFRFGVQLEGDTSAIRRRIKGFKADTVLDTQDKVKGFLGALGKAYDWYQEQGDIAENVNRAALYAQLRADNKSHLYASLKARDLMDFSQRGAWPAVRFLTTVIPFLNARLQGLDKLYRGGFQPVGRALYGTASASERKQAIRFAGTVAAVSMASVLLYLAYRDDDDFKKREQWDRDSYWWFKIGDTPMRIPKPFEVGALGTLAERAVEQFADPEVGGDLFAERLRFMLTHTFAFDWAPQMIKPMLELGFNENFFTKRPIETMGMERLSPTERYRANTSLGARGLSEASNAVGLELSPVQVEHLVRGYFGWLGAQSLSLADIILRPTTGVAERPTRGLRDLPVIGDLIASFYPDGRASRYTTEFYDELHDVRQVVADVNHFRKVGQTDKAKQLIQENREMWANRKLLEKIARDISDINARILVIGYQPGMDGAQKQLQIDRLTERKSTLAKNALALIRRRQQKVA